MIGRKRNRRKIADRYEVAEPAESGGEVWPAYVDVLASAFAFILLAFLATLTKETKAREEVEHRVHSGILRRDRENAALQQQRHRWSEKKELITKSVTGVFGTRIATRYSAETRPCLDVINFKDLCVLASTELEEGTSAGASGVRPLKFQYQCTLSEDHLEFEREKATPKNTAKTRQVLACLAELAKDLADHACCPPGDTTACSSTSLDNESWCAAGMDVEGHADCLRFEGREKTNWELSSERAGAVIRRMGERANFVPTAAFRVKATGFEQQQLKDLSCDCGRRDDPCHKRNRRVVLNFAIRSREAIEPLPSGGLR